MGHISSETAKINRGVLFKIFGTVQGVGFRPEIYRQATSFGLCGYVKNCGDFVELYLEGDQQRLKRFIEKFESFIPENATVDKLVLKWIDPLWLNEFSIVESSQDHESDLNHFQNLSFPPDFSTCNDCLHECNDPDNRRYHYPFITCTDCGPRYSLVNNLPYDRERTTMNKFVMCDECLSEYHDPLSRRFHAQNIACSQCGPSLSLFDDQFEEIQFETPKEVLEIILKTLKQGKVIALKGLGGFQLICDGQNISAIKRLRKRKSRPHQSLAVMARGPEILDEPQEVMELLQSKAAPIVIVKKSYNLPIEEISPDAESLGIFLPTTPLHHYLFGISKKVFDFLIVTSGNAHGVPMSSTDEEAKESLVGIADLFISHNREIQRSIDDSVINAINEMQVIRSGRGLTPKAINYSLDHSLLALGGDLKNSFALSGHKKIYLSPHMGDLYNLNTVRHFQRSVEDYLNFSGVGLKGVVVDKHPAYMSRDFGVTLSKKYNIPLMEVQHHRAHVVSVMCENKITQAIGISFDGTGYGDDDQLWGGECFIIDLDSASWRREFSISPTKLIGGEQAIFYPGRVSLEKILSLGLKIPEHLKDSSIESLYKSGLKFPNSSSVGRLFDAVSALLMPKYKTISYEGQAAIGLERLARKAENNECDLDICWLNNQIDGDHLFLQIFKLYEKGEMIEKIALYFHHLISKVTLEMCIRAKEISDLKKVVLSGGVFQNALLVQLVNEKLKACGFEVYLPKQIPINDGGLALGQLVIADILFKKGDLKDA